MYCELTQKQDKEFVDELNIDDNVQVCEDSHDKIELAGASQFQSIFESDIDNHGGDINYESNCSNYDVFTD